MLASKSPSATAHIASIHQITSDIQSNIAHAEAAIAARASAAASASTMEVEAPASHTTPAPNRRAAATASSPAAVAAVAATPAPSEHTRSFGALVSAAAAGESTSAAAASAAEYNFQTLHRRLDPNVNSKVELTRVKEHFGKLKTAYLQTETRQSMLDALSAGGATDVESSLKAITVDQSVVDKLASAVSDSKKKIGATKKHIKATKTQLLAMAQAIENKFESFQSKKALYDEFVNEQTESKLKAAHDQRIDVNANSGSSAYGGSATSNDALQLTETAHCELIAERQRTVVAGWNTALAEQKARNHQLNAQTMQPLQKEMEWLQKELSAAEAEKVRLSKNAYLDGQRAWFSAANTIMSATNAVSAQWKSLAVVPASTSASAAAVVTAATSNVLVYTLNGAATAPNGDRYSLEFTYNYDRTHFSAVKVVPPNSGIDMSDIIAYGVPMQDSAFVVRECTERIRCVNVRAQHIAALAQRMKCDSEAGKEAGTVVVSTTLPYAGGRDVRAMWSLPIDYSSPHAVVNCYSLGYAADSKGADTAASPPFQQWMTAVNQNSAGLTLADCVTRLQQIIAPATATAAAAASAASPAKAVAAAAADRESKAASPVKMDA